jgi:hypothetical protein
LGPAVAASTAAAEVSAAGKGKSNGAKRGYPQNRFHAQMMKDQAALAKHC